MKQWKIFLLVYFTLTYVQVDVPGLPLVAAGVVEGDVHVGGALLQLGVTELVSVQLTKLITIRISCQFPYYLSGLSSPSSSSAPPRMEGSSSPLVLNERRFCNNRSLKGPTHFRTRTKQNKCKFSSPPPPVALGRLVRFASPPPRRRLDPIVALPVVRGGGDEEVVVVQLERKLSRY